MVITVSHKPSLIKRQQECGRLLGQWRKYHFILFVHAVRLIYCVVPDAEAGVEYEVQRFRGTFGWKTPWTGIGPKVDAAWDNITDGKICSFYSTVQPERVVIIAGPIGGAIGITKEQWEAVNEYHDFPVMLEKDHGTGQYLGSLDVCHQLHCVVSISFCKDYIPSCFQSV
jgi:hypothetical protein